MVLLVKSARGEFVASASRESPPMTSIFTSNGPWEARSPDPVHRDPGDPFETQRCLSRVENSGSRVEGRGPGAVSLQAPAAEARLLMMYRTILLLARPAREKARRERFWG